jgi:2-alkyl-3-oxoalkanoate reductase
MKLFLTGATGALGKRLVPLLLAGGHSVVATTRAASKVDGLRSAGAEPVVVDALDRDAIMKAVVTARPDVVIHEMTALSNVRNLRKFDEEFALTNRLRTAGTDFLLAAAQASGARKFIAQSYAGWPTGPRGPRVKTEDEPLDSDPPKATRRSLDAFRHLETVVPRATGLTGIVLRYGSFYGPSTSLCAGGVMLEMVRQRKLPIFGDGAGIWSFLHIDDAAMATRLAVERGATGIYNIVDDEPAEVSLWLPWLAQAIEAPPPYHLPAWIGRLLIGEAGVFMMTKARGASNAKARRALNWQPIYPSWRDGFRHGLAADPGKVPYLQAV